MKYRYNRKKKELKKRRALARRRLMFAAKLLTKKRFSEAFTEAKETRKFKKLRERRLSM